MPRTASRSLLFALTVAAPLAALAAAGAGPARGHPLRAGNPHLAGEVSCKDCHGKGEPRAPALAATCLSCHGPSEALVQRTAAVQPENPHTSPHWGASMECYVCHRQHQPTVNWCAHCHEFDVAVP